MRVRPRQHSSWLFPVMVVAATCVVAFGVLGLAVVTGHARGKQGSPASADSLVTAEAAKGTATMGNAEAATPLSPGVSRN